MKRFSVVLAMMLFCGLLVCCSGSGGSSDQGDSLNPNQPTIIPASIKSVISQRAASTFFILSIHDPSDYFWRTLNERNYATEDGTYVTYKGEGLYVAQHTLYTADKYVCGIAYRYPDGQEFIQLRDASGSSEYMTYMNTDLADSIEIFSRMVHGYYFLNPLSDNIRVDINIDGRMTFTGFLEAETNGLVVTLEDYTQSGTIEYTDKTIDTFILSIPLAEVHASPSSFPYPQAGEQETGAIEINGASSTYTINYDGSSTAEITMAGALKGTFTVDLATNKID